MNWNFETALAAFSKGQNRTSLVKGLHGLEKESLRIDANGHLAMTPHPKAIGNSLTDPHITTDFSESQVEFITPPFPKPEQTVAFLEKLHRFTLPRIGDEMLWPFSMPGHLPNVEDIPIAYYGESKEAKQKEIYRRGLALRYGKYMQTISGVHHNFSFSPKLWDVLMKLSGTKLKKQAFMNEGYLHIVRNFIRYRWLLVYLFGASPFHDPTYKCRLLNPDRSEAVSLRSSRCGYSNPAKIDVDYNSFDKHLKSLIKATKTPHPAYTKLGLKKDGSRLRPDVGFSKADEQIQLNDHILQIGNEYYFSIRLKPATPVKDLLGSLRKNGVAYIEVRIFDLNPFEPTGVTVDQLYFSQLFLLYCLFKTSPPVDQKVLDEGTENQQMVALKGRNPSLQIQQNGRKIKMLTWAEELLTEMKPLAQLMDQNLAKPRFTKLINHYQKALKNPATLPAFKAVRELQKTDQNFLKYGLRKAKTYAKKLRTA